MSNQKKTDYNTLSREELVKVATDLRDERDMLRQAMRNDMRRFCEDVVPDFLLLGGNRPDCAVASASAVSLSDATFNNVTVGTGTVSLLPPDVFACTAGILCAPVIITGRLHTAAAVQLCERKGPARTLSVRLQFQSEAEMQQFRSAEETDSDVESDETDDEEEDKDKGKLWLWANKNNNFHAVSVKMELPPEVVTLPDSFFEHIPTVKSIDLRSTRLTALGNYCMKSWGALSQVHLPSTLVSIGHEFLANARDITSIDLRHLTGLTSLGSYFMYLCTSLTEVHLPPSVTQLSSTAFLDQCRSLVSIDLRPLTGLTSLEDYFMTGCDSLTEVHLPPSVTQISDNFLEHCKSIVSIDLRPLTRLTSLGEDFMFSCSSLTEVHLPDSVTELPDHFLLECGRPVACHFRPSRREKRKRAWF